LPLVWQGDPYLIDPELGWFIGMHIVHRGGEADDQRSVARYHDVMAGIGEEFGAPPGVDRLVEDIRRYVVENGSLVVL
jgi:hypothetical protein